jgi:transcriptional regulator with XRE-family HTH domain
VSRLRKYLEAKGLGAAEFANALKMNRPTVLHILNGRNKPNIMLLQRLAEFDPEVDLRYLLTGISTSLPGQSPPPTPRVKRTVESRSHQNESSKLIILKPDGTYEYYSKDS